LARGVSGSDPVPDGRLVEDFYSIAIPEYVVVAAFDSDGNVLLERHYRHGAGATTSSLPSGYVDPGEKASEAARRELREETGYTASSWELLPVWQRPFANSSSRRGD
jgi:ADP-ribose pyrophosphatase